MIIKHLLATSFLGKFQPPLTSARLGKIPLTTMLSWPTDFYVAKRLLYSLHIWSGNSRNSNLEL